MKEKGSHWPWFFFLCIVQSTWPFIRAWEMLRFPLMLTEILLGKKNYWVNKSQWSLGWFLCPNIGSSNSVLFLMKVCLHPWKILQRQRFNLLILFSVWFRGGELSNNVPSPRKASGVCTNHSFINGLVQKWFKKWENIHYKILMAKVWYAKVLTEAVSGNNGNPSQKV